MGFARAQPILRLALGGNCRGEARRQIWSAARPAGDKIANQHYYDDMQKNHPNVSVNPPARACVPVPQAH